MSSKSIALQPAHPMTTWADLLAALLAAMTFSALYVALLSSIVRIAFHWSPSLVAVCCCFGGVSLLCCSIIVAWFSRQVQAYGGEQ